MKYDEILHVVVQGDFGYLHSSGHFGGHPFVFHDLFQVSGGRCVEADGADTDAGDSAVYADCVRWVSSRAFPRSPRSARIRF